jgi:hypothetical protein
MALEMGGFDGIVLSDRQRVSLEAEVEMAAYLTSVRDALRQSAQK